MDRLSGMALSTDIRQRDIKAVIMSHTNITGLAYNKPRPMDHAWAKSTLAFVIAITQECNIKQQICDPILSFCEDMISGTEILLG